MRCRAKLDMCRIEHIFRFSPSIVKSSQSNRALHKFCGIRAMTMIIDCVKPYALILGEFYLEMNGDYASRLYDMD